MEYFTIIIFINFLKEIFKIYHLYKRALMTTGDILHIQKSLLEIKTRRS